MIDDPHGKGFGLNMDHGKVHVNLTSVWVDDAIRVESEETLAANRWYHLAATYDGSKVADNVRIYIDGRPVKTKVLMDTLYRPYRNAKRKFDHARPHRRRLGSRAPFPRPHQRRPSVLDRFVERRNRRPGRCRFALYSGGQEARLSAPR